MPNKLGWPFYIPAKIALTHLANDENKCCPEEQAFIGLDCWMKAFRENKLIL
jgi:hypothetical protein